jgi:hypothetical protein
MNILISTSDDMCSTWKVLLDRKARRKIIVTRTSKLAVASAKGMLIGAQRHKYNFHFIQPQLQPQYQPSAIVNRLGFDAIVEKEQGVDERNLSLEGSFFPLRPYPLRRKVINAHGT